jgi:hypothetical protein
LNRERAIKRALETVRQQAFPFTPLGMGHTMTQLCAAIVNAIADELGRGDGRVGRLSTEPDPQLQAIVDTKSWAPARSKFSDFVEKAIKGAAAAGAPEPKAADPRGRKGYDY